MAHGTQIHRGRRHQTVADVPAVPGLMSCASFMRLVTKCVLVESQTNGQRRVEFAAGITA